MDQIETERLVLRPLCEADIDDLLEYHADEQVVRYIPWHQRSRQDVEDALEGYKNNPSELKHQGDSIVLGWELRTVRKIIGQSNISLVSEKNKTIDLGWVTHPKFWRQGYALEASRAMLAFAFSNFDVHRVIAHIDMRNPESAKLAEKLGMRREGEFQKAVFTKGEWCDMWEYAMLKEEFSKG